jgi:peptide/nickel transport system substrate-binding protein
VTIIWFFIFFISFAWGCTESSPESTIRIGLAIAPSNLDPRLATDAPSARVNRLLYSRLVDFAEDATLIPALATWEVLTPTQYRFHLIEPRPTFPNGTQLTAMDVKETYTSLLDPKTASPHRSLLQNISRIETPSETTIDFFLLHPDPLFPSYLVIGILPANLIAIKHPFHDDPVGSGPFLFEQRPDDSRLILKRRNDAQLIEFVKVLNPTVRTMKLLAGEIHLLQNDLPPELVTYLSENPSISFQQKKGSKFSYIGFNHQDPVVGQNLVRKAIAHAINREQIIQYALGGRARLAQALFPPDHWVGASQLEGYSYDPPRARELLRQAGFTSERTPTLIYKTSTDPFRLRLATIVQEQLQQVGIHMSIHSHDWGTFYGDIKSGHFQMYSLAWVGLKTPDIFRHAFHSQSVPPLGVNRGRYTDPVTDDLIAKAERTSGANQQQRIYQLLQARLLDNLPYVPLWYEDNVALSTKAIQGYTLKTDGNFDGLLHIQWAASSTIQPQIARQTDS